MKEEKLPNKLLEWNPQKEKKKKISNNMDTGDFTNDINKKIYQKMSGKIDRLGESKPKSRLRYE